MQISDSNDEPGVTAAITLRVTISIPSMVLDQYDTNDDAINAWMSYYADLMQQNPCCDDIPEWDFEIE